MPPVVPHLSNALLLFRVRQAKYRAKPPNHLLNRQPCSLPPGLHGSGDPILEHPRPVVWFPGGVAHSRQNVSPEPERHHDSVDGGHQIGYSVISLTTSCHLMLYARWG